MFAEGRVTFAGDQAHAFGNPLRITERREPASLAMGDDFRIAADAISHHRAAA